MGEDLWGKFGGGRDGTLWYYRQMVVVLESQVSGTLVSGSLMKALRETVQQLELISDRNLELAE
jgi:hypothetical protein